MPKIKGAGIFEPKSKSTTLALTIATIFTFTALLATNKVAQAGLARGVSTGLVEITGDAKVGSIISHKGNEYTLAIEPYDTEIIGVVVENSSVSILEPTQTPRHLILQSGEAQILVSNTNGDIKKGDYITSSTQAGTGQKADKSGFVIGKATEDFLASNGNEPGLVWSTVEPKHAFINNTVKTNLLDALRSGALSPLLNPVESLRYILAALIVVATFVIGFSTFGKTSGRTIEALGRNPLAQGTIRTAMIFNTILAFGVMLIGLALAYLILVL